MSNEKTPGSVRQAIKFVLFSISAGVLQFLTFTLLNELLHLPYWGSYLPALVVSVLYNFTVNRAFTFQSANNIPIAMFKVALYYVVFTPLSTWGGQLLKGQAGWNEYIVLGITMVTNMVTEFLFCRFVVYRGSMGTNSRAQKKLNVEDQNRDLSA